MVSFGLLLSATLNMIPPNCAQNRRVAGGENVIFMCGVSHNVTSCLLMISLSSADNNSILCKHEDEDVPKTPITVRECHEITELCLDLTS